MTASLAAALILAAPVRDPVVTDSSAVGSVSCTAHSEHGTGVIVFRDGKRAAHGSTAARFGWVLGPVAVRAVPRGGGRLYEAEVHDLVPGKDWSAELSNVPNGHYFVWAVHTVYHMDGGAVDGHQLVGSALAEVAVVGSRAADPVVSGEIGFGPGWPKRSGDGVTVTAAGTLRVDPGWCADWDGIQLESIPVDGGVVRAKNTTPTEDGSGWTEVRDWLNHQLKYNVVAVARLVPDPRNRPRDGVPHRIASAWARLR